LAFAACVVILEPVDIDARVSLDSLDVEDSAAAIFRRGFFGVASENLAPAFVVVAYRTGGRVLID